LLLSVLPTSSHPVRCLILACGNTLRSDDGVGPWLAAWAEERFGSEPSVSVISRHQWTSDLAEEVAHAESVLFIDCAIDSAPGEIAIAPVAPAASSPALATHHTGAAELLALGNELYDSQPGQALLLTIGAGSTEMGETFSKSVNDALPEACRLIEKTVRDLMAS
jgi:hydrogenase maturation protease